MRNLSLWCVLILSAPSTFAQFNTPWTTNTSNSASSGFIGVGTKSTNGATNTPLPNFNFQVHGVADYIDNGGQTGIIQSDSGHDQMNSNVLKSGTNYGKTSRIGLTNSVTSNGPNDGTVLMMAQNDFYLLNREAGNVLIGNGGLRLQFDNASNRLWLGSPISGTTRSDSKYSKFSIVSNDHGLYIQTVVANKVGLRIKNHSDNASAIEVFGTSTTLPNFKVFGSGTVYARKYVTTLNNFPDYVFQPEYQLMPLTELRNYIQVNKHLPNVPSATTIESEGADLGELNRILVEKVEELTLYILQMEARINELEKQNVD